MNRARDVVARVAAGQIGGVAGVGPKRLEALRECQISTFRDALMHLPYRYEDLRRRHTIAQLYAGMDAVVEGQLSNVTQRPMRGRPWRRITLALFRGIAGGTIRTVWFNLRGEGAMPEGEPVLLAGRVSAATDGSLELVHPELIRLKQGEVCGIRPVYRLPRSVPQSVFANVVARALEQLEASALDAIPGELRDRTPCASLREALEYLHRPPAEGNLEELSEGETAAHQMLALDEMFAFQVVLARERLRQRQRNAAVMEGPHSLATALLAGLLFMPTGAQLRAIDEIRADLGAPRQMNRLLIGDVGSGKTLVAFHAALTAAESGWQTAMMAPTELLAEQHAQNFERMCGRLGVTSALLTGRASEAERGRILRALQRGDVAVVFGTQALIQKSVAFRRLGLAIIDEQHRFGVFDRARLMALGSQANVLLMTATPIPRSLALTLFRSLDVSTLDEMPPGRTPVATTIYSENELSQVDEIVRTELGAGRRAYYILPLIETDDENDDSVVAMTKRLSSGPLKGFRVGALHGRMRPAEKDRIMREFRDGTLDVLASTTVVEVGIDVPEASAIVVIAAERYGLAQLHQLRGRVGRGSAASRCCLVLSVGASNASVERLEGLARCADGAELAALDLRIRGPGDMLGTRQTGALPLRFAGWIRDFSLIERAGDMAEEWLRRDPGLDVPESAGVRAAIARILRLGFSLGDVG